MGNEDFEVMAQHSNGSFNISKDKMPLSSMCQQPGQSINPENQIASKQEYHETNTPSEPGSSTDAFNQIDKNCDTESQEGIGNNSAADDNIRRDNTENKAVDDDIPQDKSEKRSSRKRKLALTSGSGLLCIIQYCGLSFPDPHSLDRHHQGHLSQEIERVDKVRVKKSSLNLPERIRLRKNRSETYERLRAKRESRHALPILQRPSTSQQFGATTSCPVCQMSVEGSLDEFSEHVEACLRVDQDPIEEDVIDVESEDYEEYEWAGQTRVRATSLFRGGLRGAGFLTIQRTGEDEELDVTGEDEEDGVGPAQYSDMDMFVMAADTAQEEEERRELREAVIGKEEEVVDDESESQNEPESEVSRLRKENTKLKNSSLCKICMEGYTRPLTSTACWHVHCEQCWLLALGAKKLCPQCKVIVRPEDLRKIFL